jgi:hypothetical protein
VKLQSGSKMTDIISWDKAIDKKVKSSDEKDLGKIQSVTRDYIQTKEGTVAKKYYYIPKYYLQGYDGDHLWISLSKDDVKSRFEGEKAPPAATFETPDYVQRKTTVAKQYPDFETNIPTYAGKSATSPDSVAMPWDKIIDRKVKSSDNEDMGKVESIATNYVQGFDGEYIRTSLTKNEIKDRYERDSPPTESEFQTQEYIEQKRKVDSSAGEALDIQWEEVIHKRLKTTDNVDIGDIDTVGNEFIVVSEGVARIRHYYIPKLYINNYDGSSLYVAVPKWISECQV